MLTRRLFLGLFAALSLVAAVPATPQATTCSNEIPPGYFVTPACTWIVAQVDPGVWIDNVGIYWVLDNGTGMPRPRAIGRDIEVLKIGEWKRR